MLIKKSESKKHENSEQCTVWEYEFPSKNLSFATSLINGRYPTEKRATNTECEEVYFVMSGSGTVHTDKGNFEISVGDLYYFEIDEAYWVEGVELSLALINSPRWMPEQHKIVE